MDKKGYEEIRAVLDPELFEIYPVPEGSQDSAEVVVIIKTNPRGAHLFILDALIKTGLSRSSSEAADTPMPNLQYTEILPSRIIFTDINSSKFRPKQNG